MKVLESSARKKPGGGTVRSQTPDQAKVPQELPRGIQDCSVGVTEHNPGQESEDDRTWSAGAPKLVGYAPYVARLSFNSTRAEAR